MTKKNLINLFVIMLFTVSVNAQQLTLGKVLDVVSDMEVFVKNRKLKKNILDQVDSVKNKDGLTVQEYKDLKDAYEMVSFTYNDLYLASIKADLSNIKEIKKMVKKPERYASRYADAYRIVVENYNNELLPAVMTINGSEGDVIKVIEVGVQVFKQIVSIFSKRKEEREEQLQVVLSIVNQKLFKKIALPHWDELGIRMPANQVASKINQRTNSNPTNASSRPIPTKVKNVPPPTSTVPVVKEALTGKITSEYYTESGMMAMAFEKSEVSVVRTPNFQAQGDLVMGKPGSSKSSVDVEAFRFHSSEKFPTDTYYRMAIESNGLVYIFAVNSGNKMYGFYPGQGETRSINESSAFVLPPNADQVLGKPGSATTSNGSVVNIPDKENYIHISDTRGSSIPESETMVVLISTVELDIKSVMEEMEEMGADLSVQERLATIFGNQAATASEAHLDSNGKDITFSLKESKATVIPLTLSVLRK